MSDTEYALPPRQRRPELAAAIKSVFRGIVMWLTLLLIGILSIPAFLFLSLMEAVWELADTAIRAMDARQDP